MKIKEMKDKKITKKILPYGILLSICLMYGCGDISLGGGSDLSNDSPEVMDLTDLGIGMADNSSEADDNNFAEGIATGIEYSDLQGDNQSSSAADTSNLETVEPDNQLLEDNLDDNNEADEDEVVLTYESPLGYELTLTANWKEYITVMEGDGCTSYICGLAEEENYTGLIMQIFPVAQDEFDSWMDDKEAADYTIAYENEDIIFIAYIPEEPEYDKDNAYVSEIVNTILEERQAVVDTLEYME